MLTLNDVTLRPMELEDIEKAYMWHCNLELEMLSGWGARSSLATFKTRFEEFLHSPPANMRIFGIEVASNLVGRIELSAVDLVQGHAMLGLLIGERKLWGRRYGTTAVRVMLDYAFTVENLHRVYAHVYDFNHRSQRLMESVGLVKEGILRKHEVHNGARRDLFVYGILKDEFYMRYNTVFELPADPSGV